jgi:hypothetical protein
LAPLDLSRSGRIIVRVAYGQLGPFDGAPEDFQP